jgi:hypothetical protein
MAVDNVIECVTIQWKAIVYASRITKIHSFDIYSETKSQEKYGKTWGIRNNLNISYIFCTYSQCQKMDEIKAIDVSVS